MLAFLTTMAALIGPGPAPETCAFLPFGTSCGLHRPEAACQGGNGPTVCE